MNPALIVAVLGTGRTLRSREEFRFEVERLKSKQEDLLRTAEDQVRHLESEISRLEAEAREIRLRIKNLSETS